MNIQTSADQRTIRVTDFPTNGELTIEQATELGRDLWDAVRQCGYEIKMTVDVPRHIPTDTQVETATVRVAHIRRANQDRPWNDLRTNKELVMRVLEACL
jgi:hypothetical protein